MCTKVAKNSLQHMFLRAQALGVHLASSAVVVGKWCVCLPACPCPCPQSASGSDCLRLTLAGGDSTCSGNGVCNISAAAVVESMVTCNTSRNICKICLTRVVPAIKLQA